MKNVFTPLRHAHVDGAGTMQTQMFCVHKQCGGGVQIRFCREQKRYASWFLVLNVLGHDWDQL